MASGPLAIPTIRIPGLLLQPDPQHPLWRSVLLDVRLPRVITAIITGAGLAVSGAALQALFRNPLAEPGLVGISAGGALGAIAVIVLGASNPAILASTAFLGSLAATLLCYTLGSRQHGIASLLLAGVAINAICGSLISLLTYVADSSQLRSLTFWAMGSLANVSWPTLACLTPWTLVLSLLLWRNWRAMNALLLGEREAMHLGFALKPLRRRLIVLVSLLVGPLVAFTGAIGFVGLVVPHLIRLTLGANHKALLPGAFLGGAIALTLADWMARTALMPAELPVGVVTSLIGGPFFLWLLSRRPR